MQAVQRNNFWLRRPLKDVFNFTIPASAMETHPRFPAILIIQSNAISQQPQPIILRQLLKQSET